MATVSAQHGLQSGFVLALASLPCFPARIGLAADCNRNGIEDAVDIAGDRSRDCNANAVPDECDLAPLFFRYEAAGALATEKRFGSLEVLDLDGDRDLDLLAAYTTADSGEVSVLLNAGDGTIVLAVSHPTGRYPSGSTAGDLDGDALPEILAADAALRRVAILRNRVQGRFDAWQDLELDKMPREPIVQDLDADGDNDLALLVDEAVNSGFISAYLNDGAGRLAPGEGFSTGQYSVVLAAGDLDGNGTPDLMAGNYFTSSARVGSVSVFLNDGGASFGEAPRSPTIGEPLVGLSAADLDGDHDLDLAAVIASRRGVSVLLNRGDGTFSPAKNYIRQGWWPFAAVDLDEDGGVDLVVGNSTTICEGELVTVAGLFNTGDGSFGKPIDLGIQGHAGSVVAADLDGDGHIDLAVAPQSPDQGLLTFIRRAAPRSQDCNANGIPDECDRIGADCNRNLIPDDCDLRSGAAEDCNANGLPDACDRDCNGSGLPDECDVARGASLDCNQNRLPDECEIAAADLNANGIPDDCDLRSGVSLDCNQNGIPDEEDVVPGLLFSAPPRPRLGTARAIVPADMNGDGRVDLVITRQGAACPPMAASASVLVQRGHSLEEVSRLPLGLTAEVAAVGDLDGDRDLDVAASGGSEPLAPDQWLSLLMNRGDGTLAPGPVLSRGLAPRAVALDDLDGDADLDLVLLAEDGSEATLGWSLNDGSGAYRPRGSFQVPGGMRFLATGDLDGDGDVDLATATAMNTITMLFNDGTAAFALGARLDVSGPVESLTAADLDGDRDLDFAFATRGPDGVMISLAVLANQGDGVFAGESLVPIGLRSSPLLVQDLDGDADLDLVGSVPEASLVATLAILRNRGDGMFVPGQRFPVALNLTPAAVADLDGDQQVDLLLRDSDGEVLAYRQRGGATFVAPAVFPTGGQPRSLAAADLDGDGDADVALADVFSARLLLNDSAGAFTPGPRLLIGSDPSLVIAEDLDGDGDHDLATLNAGLQPSNVSVLLNEGRATFAPARNHAVEDGPTGMAAGDLTGEGDPDLVVANSSSGSFSLLPSLGSGAFAPALSFPVSQSPTSIATADLDGDGDVDVLCTSPAGDANGRGSISFFSGLGNGSFLAEATINAGGLPQSLVVGDWNDDGRLDLATVNALSVSLVLSVEGGKFARPIDHASGTSATRLITADLDADGDLDLAANGTENAVHILLNHGTGRFGALIDLAVHLPIHFLAAEDLNGDTRLDLAALAVGDSRVLVIENLSRPFSSDQDRDAVPDECDPVSALPFRRGDANQDAKVNISDPVSILRHLFMAGGRLGCRKAADANDDGKLDLSDAVSILQFLFLGQGGLPEPFLSCGVDSTEDLLDCEAFLPCAA